ncbi:MAG: ABC transporter ATP-binding protein [Solirubrobacteraceae bacterium]
MSRLSLVGIRCEFDGVVAVEDVSFECGAGITGLIGPNGAGKSTLLNAISGHIRPVAGAVSLDGEDISRLSPHVLARKGIVRTFQISNVFQRMSVVENLLVGGSDAWQWMSLRKAVAGPRAWRSWQEAQLIRAYDLMARFRMSHMAGTFAGELSGGQRRLVEIMRCLMRKPRFLLLDEPMAGVSPALSVEIAESLRALADGGLGILLIEHELAFVESLCQRIVVLANGRLLMEGSMAEVRRNEQVIEAYIA